MYEKIDSGTLARTVSRAPSVVTGDSSAKQRSSWTRLIRDLPRSGEEMTAMLGQIYFRTNEHVLDADDKLELRKLCANLRSLLEEGYRFDLLCTGNADYRASDAYNLRLGDRRAESVKSFITHAVPASGLRVLKVSLGESNAEQPGRGKKFVSRRRMAYDRRVDITFGTVVPPVRIGITGNWIHTRTLQMLEINNGECDGDDQDELPSGGRQRQKGSKGEMHRYPGRHKYTTFRCIRNTRC